MRELFAVDFVGDCEVADELRRKLFFITASELNALFGILHNNTGNKTISIYENPGAGDCDRSIAERKGWRVNR